VNARFDPRNTGPAGEYFVEVIGPDGLKHHVGPFKHRAEAEEWIAQNPSDGIAARKRRKKSATPKKKT
jgi:hypothetical protein